MPPVRIAALLTVLLAVTLLPAPSAPHPQREGPLEVKVPPPRPPKAEAEDATPTEPRGPGSKRRAALSPCPAGYIPKPAPDDDERPPRLRRGSPEEHESAGANRKSTEPECVWSEVVVSADGTVTETLVSPGNVDPFLEKVRGKVFSFSDTLPDFICDQLTDRYRSRSTPPKWKLQDRISAEVLLVNGKESYRNIKRNGKKLKRGTPQATGAWSTGEFSTMMQDLFSHATRAEFSRAKPSEIGGKMAEIYEYTVEQSNSHFRIDFEGHVMEPAYRGSVWIDPDSLRVVRIEVQPREIPPDYPMDTIELTIDYGLVRISGQDYLLVTKAENLSCKRYSKYCARNEIEFRNYRKFAVESSISTTDSTVSYEGEEKKDGPD